jgi:hypothetical protein
VLVAPRDHEHLVAAQSVEAGKDVGWHVDAGQVANVQRAVGVGPGQADENAFAQIGGGQRTSSRGN